MEPRKRPAFYELCTSLEKIDKSLVIQEESEDNMNSNHHATPQILGEEMSKDDPFYTPSTMDNPFIGWKTYGKILGTSRGKDSFGFELPSPSDPYTPPCTPRTPDSTLGRRRKKSSSSKSQSLPSSPVLLRKAAERLHQESLHGSVTRRHSTINQNKFTFSVYFPRSKSTIFPEALAQKLQDELDCENGDEKSRNHNKSKKKLFPRRQLSVEGAVTDTDTGYSKPKFVSGSIDGVTDGLNYSWNMPYTSSVRDYLSSRSSSESFLSIEEGLSPILSPTEHSVDQNCNQSDKGLSKIAFSESVTVRKDYCETRVSEDGDVIETSL
ncbi:hypothetical protein FSP39_022445 [Pinctada imbricata]|uniref:Uncharacterized protein n=1 Tax=Pinctada imbricata TaxID=66713 RepID=A0AA89BUW4_PINIB|nr:hypothetical protein FSP39_022445 [Pinctada imbricata]